MAISFAPNPNGYLWACWQVSRVGDKDLYVKAGTFTARQPPPEGALAVVTTYNAGSLKLERI